MMWNIVSVDFFGEFENFQQKQKENGDRYNQKNSKAAVSVPSMKRMAYFLQVVLLAHWILKYEYRSNQNDLIISF